MLAAHPPAELLARLAVLGVILNWGALIVCLWRGRRALLRLAAEPGRRAWGGLLLVLAAGVGFQLLVVAPKHLVYMDEQWYLEAGKNLLLYGWTPVFGKALGWPVLVAGSYLLGGLGNYSALYLGLALGALSIPLLFMLSWVLTRSAACALLAAALWAFMPARMVWSATAETAVPALTFLLGALVLWRRSLDDGDRHLAWCGVALWALAVQIRPESGMFLFLLAAGAWLWRRAEYRQVAARTWTAAAAALVVLLPNVYMYHRFMSVRDWMALDSGGLAQGSNLGLDNMARNVLKLTPHAWDGSMHPPLLALLSGAGFAYLVWRRRREAAFLALWWALLFAFYFGSNLDFYGGTAELFPKTKLLLHFYPALVLAAGCGLCAAFWEGWGRSARGVSLVLAALLVWTWPSCLRAWPLRSDSRELETRLLSDLGTLVPEGCVLVAASPVMAGAVNRLPVVAADDFLSEGPLRPALIRGARCILFLDDLACRLGLPDLARTCVAMKRRFPVRPFLHVSQGGSRYTLYTIKPPPP